MDSFQILIFGLDNQLEIMFVFPIIEVLLRYFGLPIWISQE